MWGGLEAATYHQFRSGWSLGLMDFNQSVKVSLLTLDCSVKVVANFFFGLSNWSSLVVPRRHEQACQELVIREALIRSGFPIEIELYIWNTIEWQQFVMFWNLRGNEADKCDHITQGATCVKALWLYCGHYTTPHKHLWILHWLGNSLIQLAIANHRDCHL